MRIEEIDSWLIPINLATRTGHSDRIRIRTCKIDLKALSSLGLNFRDRLKKVAYALARSKHRAILADYCQQTRMAQTAA